MISLSLPDGLGPSLTRNQHNHQSNQLFDFYKIPHLSLYDDSEESCSPLLNNKNLSNEISNDFSLQISQLEHFFRAYLAIVQGKSSPADLSDSLPQNPSHSCRSLIENSLVSATNKNHALLQWLAIQFKDLILHKVTPQPKGSTTSSNAKPKISHSFLHLQILLAIFAAEFLQLKKHQNRSTGAGFLGLDDLSFMAQAKEILFRSIIHPSSTTPFFMKQYFQSNVWENLPVFSKSLCKNLFEMKNSPSKLLAIEYSDNVTTQRSKATSGKLEGVKEVLKEQGEGILLENQEEKQEEMESHNNHNNEILTLEKQGSNVSLKLPQLGFLVSSIRSKRRQIFKNSKVRNARRNCLTGKANRKSSKEEKNSSRQSSCTAEKSKKKGKCSRILLKPPRNTKEEKFYQESPTIQGRVPEQQEDKAAVEKVEAVAVTPAQASDDAVVQQATGKVDQAAKEPEKFAFKLVKKKPERREREYVNNFSGESGHFSSHGHRSKFNFREMPRVHINPFMLPEKPQPDFVSVLPFNFQDPIESAKDNDETKEEDGEEEDETREGSQKELENSLDRLQLDEFFASNLKNDFPQSKSFGKGIISERWSNSDSNNLDFEDRSSQASYFGLAEIGTPTTSRKGDQSICSRDEDDGFIQVLQKKRGGKKKKDSYDYTPKREYDRFDKPKNKRQEYLTKSYTKPRNTIIYEVKNKEEKNNITRSPVTKAQTTQSNKTSPAYQNLKQQTPTNFPPLLKGNENKVAEPVAETPVRKPLKKLLSLKSQPLDLGIIRSSNVKNFAKEYFEKKFEKDFLDHVNSLSEESNAIMPYRMLAHSRIDYCLKKIFTQTNFQTEIFGSCALGLALPTSDIDICIRGNPLFYRSEVIHYLTTIDNHLSKFKWVTSIKQIFTANVPVLKLEIDPTVDFDKLAGSLDEYSLVKTIIQDIPAELNNLSNSEKSMKIKIDLSIETFDPMGGGCMSHLGLKSTYFVQKMLNEHKSLYSIAIFLKEFLNNRGFLENYQGGLSSYCLVVMIVAIFRKFSDEGELQSLMRTLRFYGEEFQPETTGITIVGQEAFFNLNACFQQAPLWILDNVNFHGKNIGQGAYAIKKILEEFKKACGQVKEMREKMESILLRHKEKINCLEDIEKLEDPELRQLEGLSIADSLVRFQS